MNEKVTQGIPLFLNQSKELFEALKKDIPAKEKTEKDFNFLNAQSLEKSFALHAKAQLAETAFETSTQDAPEAKTTFEKRHEVAAAIFQKHTVYLKEALKYNPQKLLVLGLVGQEEKTTEDWLKKAHQLYELLLVDPEVINLMGKYNLKKKDFENGQSAIVNVNNAYLALTKDRPEVKLSITNRDEAIRELVDNISETQALLLLAFEKDIKQLKKYNLPLVNDEIGREMSISMVKDSSIT